MVSLAQLLLPNLNLTAIAGLMVAFLGVFIYVVWRTAIPFLGGRIVASLSALLFVLGLLWWFIVSFAQDLLADERMSVIIGAVIVVAVMGLALFAPTDDKKRRRT